MKKLYYNLILLTLFGMLLSPFVLKTKNGKPIMSVEEFMSFDTMVIKYRYKVAMRELKGMISEKTGIDMWKREINVNQTTDMYRWQDEDGKWHFSDAVPGGVEAEKITVKHINNMMPKPDDEVLEIINEPENSSSGSGAKDGIFSGYHKSIEKAKEVQGIVNDDYQRKVEEMDKY